MKHLWEVEHSYYCEEINYYSNDCYTKYKSLSEFLNDALKEDIDMNLIFRFDWQEAKPGDSGEFGEYNGDDYYRHAILRLFYMGQGRGLYRSVAIEVCRADEPTILGFLKVRWEHMRRLWEPVSND